MKKAMSRRFYGYGGISILFAVLLLVVDQVTKYYISLSLKPAGTISVIDGLLEFTYLENTGAAFGLFKNSMWIVSAITIVAFTCMAAALFLYRRHTFFSYASLTLLISGGVGNLIDRFSYGFVIDFIHVMFFDYIFNFADCCVTVGAVLLMIHVILISRRESKESKESSPDKAPSSEESKQ